MSPGYSFLNDYSEGAHPQILEFLSKTNLQQEKGYGEDKFSQQAADLIKEHLGNKSASLHFVSGGTQANLVVLASILKPFESVISPATGHINTHETGAVEATGHKINTVETEDGKITSNQIKGILAEHSDEHMVKPKVVFISNSTELGTIYTKKDMEDLSKTCKENNLYLYLDGARLGSALASQKSDLTLKDIANYTDAFYIGGTKNGALLGEAIVINNPKIQEGFRYHIKQRGALLSKSRLIGIQFLELFRDNLFFEVAKHANTQARALTDEIAQMGYKFLTESYTNQIFPIFPNSIIEKLQEKYLFYVWSKVDNQNSAIRLVTSWATKEEAVEHFLSSLKKVSDIK